MIQAYTIKNYWLCQISGNVVAEITYCLADAVNEYKKRFANKTEADLYIQKEKRDWLLGAIEKFLTHKKQVIESSAPDAQKQKALQACLNSYADFGTKRLETITQRLLNGKSYFESILPNPNNNSYKSSAENLSEIIKFCEFETKKLL